MAVDEATELWGGLSCSSGELINREERSGRKHCYITVLEVQTQTISPRESPAALTLNHLLNALYQEMEQRQPTDSEKFANDAT